MKKFAIVAVAACCVAITLLALWQRRPAPTHETMLSATTDFYTITIPLTSEPKDTMHIMSTYEKNLFDAKKQEWREGGEAYEAEQSIAKSFPDRPKMQYEFVTTVEKTESPARKTVSYLLTNGQYTGGAHGTTDIRTFTFGDNGVIAIEDLLNLSKPNCEKLAALITAKLLSDPALAGYTSKDQISDGMPAAPDSFQNFVITDAGITFVFNQYMVAAGAVGEPRVTLTWDELRPMLR